MIEATISNTFSLADLDNDGHVEVSDEVKKGVQKFYVGVPSVCQVLLNTCILKC